MISIEDVDFGLRVAETTAPKVREVAGLMLARGLSPTAHCVLVVPAKGQPDVPPAPADSEYFMVVHTPRSVLADEFVRRGHPEVADSVRRLPVPRGRFLLVVTWAQGTQVYTPELPAPNAKGGVS